MPWAKADLADDAPISWFDNINGIAKIVGAIYYHVDQLLGQEIFTGLDGGSLFQDLSYLRRGMDAFYG